MNKINLFLICLALSQALYGQSFQEICASSTTNGTIVDCEHFKDTLYATGFFNVICGASVGYLAKWDEGEWKPSSINITDPGHSLRVINDKLYIAKYEESIDSNWVFVYDNGDLQKVGAGVYLTTASGYSELPNIYDVIEYDGNIVACGEFDRVGEASIQGVMQWDGNSWMALGMGLSGNIPQTAPVMFPHQMMVYDDELYVVGNFRNAGGIEVNGVAKWNGTEWQKMGNGFNGTVYSIVVFEDEIIAGGSFTESDGTPLNRIAKWDGTNWGALDFGFTQISSNDFTFVHTLKVIDGELFIGGGLKEITYSDNSSERCNGIVSFVGDTLNTFMGGVPNNDIEAICKTESGQILIGGGVYGNGYSGISEQVNTSIVDHQVLAEVQISPNPFEESITIDTKMEVEQYEIIDEMGKIWARGAFENKIHLNLPSGLYFLKLIDRNKSYSVHKIIRR